MASRNLRASSFPRDFLFGKDAHTQVYPWLTDFLQELEKFRSVVQGMRRTPAGPGRIRCLSERSERCGKLLAGDGSGKCAHPVRGLEDAWQRAEVADLHWWQHWAQQHGAERRVTAFLAASCRWPGLPFEHEGIHCLAQPRLQHVLAKDEAAAQGLLLLGDQIHVDANANVAETTEPGERGPQRYRDPWHPASATGELLARVATWMIVDDHEFGDKPFRIPSPRAGQRGALLKSMAMQLPVAWAGGTKVE